MISSRKNSYLKNIRRLLRSKDEALILEGPHLVGEALSCGLELETVLATPELLDSSSGRDLLPRLPRRPLEIEPSLLAEITDSDSPRGILAVARPRPRTLDSFPRQRGGIYIFAEGLQDPGNVGALARVAEASGAAGLVLGPGAAHPHHPRALRGSAGSLLRLPWLRDFELAEMCAFLQDLEPRCLALVAEGGEDLYAHTAADVEETTILLLGAEGPGLSPTALAGAHRRLTIPLAPPVESLNATVALAVALFELRRRRLSPGSPSATPVL